MSVINTGEPYNATRGRAAVLQPQIYPFPSLRKLWFKNTIVCDEGWSVAYSGNSGELIVTIITKLSDT
jgi:hypothetical protein